jgi:hypothetical protein
MDATRLNTEGFKPLTLDELAIRHQTDRASVFTRVASKAHNYAVHYDRVFTPLRDKPVKLLEIGVGGGEGIKMWLDYFQHPEAKIFGVDSRQNTNPWDTVLPDASRRYKFVYGDQSHDVFWKCFIADYGIDWDIIIDDGGHFNDQVFTSFFMLWPYVKQGGFYAIEDLGVAYTPGSIFVKPGFENHMALIRKWLDEVNTQDHIDYVYAAKELAVLRKAL